MHKITYLLSSILFSFTLYLFYSCIKTPKDLSKYFYLNNVGLFFVIVMITIGSLLLLSTGGMGHTGANKYSDDILSDLTFYILILSSFVGGVGIIIALIKWVAN